MKYQNTIILILSILLILLLLYKCDNNIPTKIQKQEISIEHFRDTLIFYDTITITNTQSIIRVDKNNKYDSSIHSNKYYKQTFKDTNYTLNTYGGFVDSISLDIYNKEIYITDSFTKTITNNIFVESKGLYIGFDINVLEKSLVAPEVTIGYMFKNQTIINGGIGIFNKQPFYSIGFKIKI